MHIDVSPSSWYKGKSITKAPSQTLPGLGTQVHSSPSPLCSISKKKSRDFTGEEGKLFQTFPCLFSFLFFLQRTPESLNDRLFKAEKTFKNNPFQPCHLALVVIRDSVYLYAVGREAWAWNQKLEFGCCLCWFFVTVGWSLNLFKSPQLTKGGDPYLS